MAAHVAAGGGAPGIGGDIASSGAGIGIGGVCGGVGAGRSSSCTEGASIASTVIPRLRESSEGEAAERSEAAECAAVALGMAIAASTATEAAETVRVTLVAPGMRARIASRKEGASNVSTVPERVKRTRMTAAYVAPGVAGGS